MYVRRVYIYTSIFMVKEVEEKETGWLAGTARRDDYVALFADPCLILACHTSPLFLTRVWHFVRMSFVVED